MKYTRYDYRRKKDDSVFIVVIFFSIILIAFLLGSAISSILMEKPSDSQNTIAPKESQTPAIVKEKEPSITEIVVVQSGLFANKANSDVLKESLKSVVNPFIIQEDDGKFRVLAGIFSESDSANIVKRLNEKQLPSARTFYQIKAEDDSLQLLAEIIKGNLQILTKLTEVDVQLVKSDEFKEWIKKLDQGDKNNKNYTLLQDYINYINTLPAEIKRDKAEENYTYIYNLIKKIGTKKQ